MTPLLSCNDRIELGNIINNLLRLRDLLAFDEDCKRWLVPFRCCFQCRKPILIQCAARPTASFRHLEIAEAEKNNSTRIVQNDSRLNRKESSSKLK